LRILGVSNIDISLLVELEPWKVIGTTKGMTWKRKGFISLGCVGIRGIEMEIGNFMWLENIRAC
jgi:hypothetical protein